MCVLCSLQEFEKLLKQKQVELLLEVKLAQKSVAVHVAQESENNMAE